MYIHYDITNGLPSNNVYMCLQDRLGYMWFATDKGVVKSNGYEFKVFTTEDGLPDNDAWRLQEDSKGRIWVNTIAHDFGYIQNDKYVDIKLPAKDGESFPSVIREANGCFYFLFGGDQLCIVNDTGKIVLDLHAYCIKNNLARPMIGQEGTVYTLSRDNGIYVYDANKKNGTNITRVCSIDFDVVANVGSISNSCVYNNTVILSYMKSTKVSLFNLHDCSIHELVFSANDAVRYEYYYNFYEYRKTLMIITNKNIYAIGTNTNLISKTPINEELLKSQLSYYYKDRQGKEWYATNTNGIFSKCTNLGEASFENKTVLNGYKYVGNWADRASCWWNESTDGLKLLTGYNTENNYEIPDNGTLKGVGYWNEQNACLSFSKGLYLLNFKEKSAHSVFLDYKTILADKLSVYKTKDSNREVIKDLMRTKFLGPARSTIRYGSVFLSVGNGLKMGRIISSDSLQIAQIDNERVQTLLLDSVGQQAILYNKNSASIYNFKTGTYRKLNFGASAYKPNIKTIQLDKFHNFYIQTDKVVYIYSPEKMLWAVQSFNADISEAIIRIKADSLFIAGQFGISIQKILGFNIFTQARYVLNSGSHFYNKCTDMTLFGSLCILNTDRGYKTVFMEGIWKNGIMFNSKNPLFRLVLKDSVQRRVENKDTISILASATRMVFDAVNPYGKGKLRYEYRIQAIDKSWVQSTGEVVLDGMAPEKYYTLEVVIKDDNWRSDPYILYVYRMPYWYETFKWKILFWAGGVLFFIVLVLIIVYVTRRYVAKANEKRQQLTDLELRAIHSQINPHFIFNTLSTALYFINKNEMENAYEHVNKFSHLLRSYLKSSQDRYISLANEIEMLRKYIELQQARFAKKFDFTIDVDNKVPANHIMIPSLLLQPLVENAIAHGLFHKKEKGLLKIYFEQGNTNEDLICVIDDNGIGRAQSKLIKDSSEIVRESYGGKLTQGLIDIFAQYEQMNIEVIYTDKIPPEMGTIVKLTIRNIKYVAGN